MSHNLAWYHPHDRLRLHRATYIDLTRMKSVVKNTSQNLGEGVPNDWRVSQYRHRLHWDWHSYLTQQFCCPLFITILKKRQFLHREQEYGNPGSVIHYKTYLIDIYTIFNTVLWLENYYSEHRGWEWAYQPGHLSLSEKLECFPHSFFNCSTY